MSDTIEAFEFNEEVTGIVQCYNDGCNFVGKMNGIIKYNDKRDIVFICPKCNTVERVRNPGY